MIVTRKNLAREALDRALEVREEAKIAFNVALCVFGLCDGLGVRVQFVDINMEGLYLVVHHTDYRGYNRLSLRRALAVVNCQLPVAWAAFRSCSHAAIVR
jgi:hypothetical protein